MSTKAKTKLALRGEALLDNPEYNKGTAFTLEERVAFGLLGRLPSRVNSLDHQVKRAYQQLKEVDEPLAQNAFLQSLKVQNWTLFYTLLARNLRELMPIIYTPTEADAIANYSRLFRRPEGLFLTYEHRDRMEEDFLEQTRNRTIDLIVVSDAEAILGIGDQGVGGIGISTAKSVIYTLVAGINPANALPIVLDVGTDNDNLLNDGLYVGWPHKRVRGKDYDTFIDQFVQLVKKHHPHCLLHFEDFGVSNAQRILDTYRSQHAIFNDDVQGTGAVTLAALMSAVGVTKSRLSDQRIIVYGAGTAGLGIARQVRDAMVQLDGASFEDASSRFWMIDKHGLLTGNLQKSGGVRDLFPKEFVRSESEWDSKDNVGLLDVVKAIRPTALIGTSTHAGAFTEEVIRAMAKTCDRPIILPLSNPSRLVEVHPKDANEWTGGKALIATGSPFGTVKMPDGKKDYVIAECNNALIYPGLGFGCILARSRTLTDAMLIAGTRRLASLSPALKDPDDALLPDFGDAPDVNFEVAVAVAEQAIEEGMADVDWKKEEVRERAKAVRWTPGYGDYEYDPKGENGY